VATLDTALALAEMDDVARTIGGDLNLDGRPSDQPFQVQPP
jgi:hypothetical protein